jgi:hypothetical protein
MVAKRIDGIDDVDQMTLPQSDAPVQDGATPAVSVLIAVHNGMPYVDSAIRSMMDQTLREIEIIVVDDASTDETPAVLARLAAEDPRIRVLTNQTNLKLAASLNRGLSVARARLIARMDADDLSMPHRLAVQKAYMDAHPEVVLLGASVRKIDDTGRVIRTSIRGRDAVAVRWLARFNMPVDHPTFMFRRLEDSSGPLRYDPALPLAQDYAFVSRVLDLGDVVILPDVLLDYRMHDTSVTATHWRDQQRICAAVSLQRQMTELPEVLVAALAPFRQAYFGMSRVEPADVFKGLRAMLAHDARVFPAHRRWMRRHAAQLAVLAFRRGGMGRHAVVRAFLTSGRDFLSALGLRFLETRQCLPRRMRRDPSLRALCAAKGQSRRSSSNRNPFSVTVAS